MGERMGRGWAAAALAAATSALALCGCAEGPRMPLVVSRHCADARFPIYFQPGSDQLTPEGAAVIRAYARRMGACRVTGAEVLGLADAGASTDPLELSQKRASVVGRALADSGLPAPSFDLVAQGAAGATTASGRRAPIHRRAEVVLHTAPAGAPATAGA